MKLVKGIIIVLMVKVAYGSKDEKQLMDVLFKTYDKNVRPVLDSNYSITVFIKHTFFQIVSVDERKELFVSNGYCSFRWTDGYLRWKPADYNGIRSITISPNIVWVPDIVLHNELDSGKGFASNVDNRQHRLTIRYDGGIVWGLRSSFETKCHFDVTYFPFDRQTCTFNYGSWSYEKSKLAISPESRIIVNDAFSHNGWFILNQSSTLLSEDYSGVEYETITFSISFKRRALSTTLNLLLPPLIVGILVLLSFVLPAASGERLALTVTLLLSLIFYTVNITDLIPSDDAAMPIFFMFFVTILAEIVLLIVVLIFSMQLYHKEAYDPPMPRWIRKIFLERLSYFVGVKGKSNRNHAIAIPREETLLDVEFKKPTDEQKNGLSHTNCTQQNGVTFNKNNVSRRMSCGQKATGDMACHTSDTDKTILMEWRIVALTVDRCLVIVFSLIWIVTILVFSLSAAFGA